VFSAYLTQKAHELKYIVVIIICPCFKPDPMIHGTSNLDHYCISYMFEVPQYGRVFYMYSAIFEHERVHILKQHLNDRC
jgi:hypothetical protein